MPFDFGGNSGLPPRCALCTVCGILTPVMHMFVFRLTVAVLLLAVLSGCAGGPAQKKTARNGQEKTSPAVAAIYARLADDEKRYFAARDPATFKNDEGAATTAYQWAWNDAQDAAALCAKTRDCDAAKFDAAFARIRAQP